MPTTMTPTVSSNVVRCDVSEVTASRREAAAVPVAYASVFPSGRTTGKTAGIVVSMPATRRGEPPLLGNARIPKSDPIRMVSAFVQYSPRTFVGAFASGMLDPPSTDTLLMRSPSPYTIHRPSGENAGCVTVDGVNRARREVGRAPGRQVGAGGSRRHIGQTISLRRDRNR